MHITYVLKYLTKWRIFDESRNAFKRDGDTATVMVTHRTMDASPEIFNAAVDTISQLLAAHFTVLPAEREFVIVDTNLSHDDQWVSA